MDSGRSTGESHQSDREADLSWRTCRSAPECVSVCCVRTGQQSASESEARATDANDGVD